jgi:acyl carrier protein
VTAPYVLTVEQARDQVRRELSKQFGDIIDAVAGGDRLPDALGDRYDSLGALECVSRIEAAFAIEVDFVAHDVRHIFATIDRIAEFVQEQVEDRTVLGEGA